MGTSLFKTKSSDITVRLPLFIPVYRPDFSFELFNDETSRYGLEAVMVNSFLLYRDTGLKERFENGHTLRAHIGGFGGMLCTDSGAFQQLSGRKVDLDPLDIVRFQNTIQTDIAAPLDLLTPPETGYDETVTRMVISQHRIEEARKVCHYADLSAIQQGGGFFSLRQKHIRQLARIGFAYYGIGSMVPFFNKNHDLTFTCKVIQDARAVIGPEVPMHVYGAGDPLDMAFMYYAGANVFDSSSYAHYAKRGYYMTKYGAVNKRAALEQLGVSCACPVCSAHKISEFFDGTDKESLLQRHNLFTILATVRHLSCLSTAALSSYITDLYTVHTGNPTIFHNSRLAASWARFLNDAPIECALASNASRTVQTAQTTAAKETAQTLSPIETDLIECMTEESAALYKVERVSVAQFIQAQYLLPQYHALRAKVCAADSRKAVLRLGDYKTFRKQVRAALYQNLRRYKASATSLETLTAALAAADNPTDCTAIEIQLLALHISTKERLPDRTDFVTALQSLTAQDSTVIDVGCGLNPMLLPPSYYKGLSAYVAVDKDIQSVELIRLYAKKHAIQNLKAFTWDIAAGWLALEQLTGIRQYDFALALKVIPVLYRAEAHKKQRQPVALDVLGRLPAATFLVTANRESMTKYQQIEKREATILRRFVTEYGFSVVSEVHFNNEFGFVLERSFIGGEKLRQIDAF